MKSTMYFNSEAEMNEYFPNGVPSNVLAIVQPEGSDKSILFTTSNNNSKSGTPEDMGGYNIDDENEEKIEYSYVGVQDWYANGATQSYVVNYVAEHGGGGSTPDLSAYVTKDELSAQSYLTAVPAEYITDAELSGMSYVTSTALENASYATTTYVADYVSTYGGGSQVQADWNESDSSSDAFIKNKPAVDVGNGTSSVFIGNVSKSDVKGLYSVAAGNWTSTKNRGEVAIGNYNKSTTDKTTFSVGIGEYSVRKNAIEIMQNGDLYAYGVGNYDGTSYSTAYTLAYVISDIQTNLGAANSIAELILGE